MKEENVSSFEFILHSQKIMLLVQTIFEIILFCLSWSNLHMHFNRHKTKCQLKRIYKHIICKLYKKLKLTSTDELILLLSGLTLSSTSSTPIIKPLPLNGNGNGTKS